MDPSDRSIPLSISGRCAPKRPDETLTSYLRRARVHRDAVRQRFVEDYYNSAQARLPSPDSDAEEEDMATAVRRVQEYIRMDSGQVDFWAYEYPVQRAHRLGIPYCNYDTPGKSLSEIADDEVSGDSYELPSALVPEPRLESGEIPDEQPNPRPRRKRKRGSDEEGDILESSAKRARTNDTDVRAADVLATTVHKRKRSQEEDAGTQTPNTSTRGQSSAKKRRTATNASLPPAIVTSIGKRKRVSDEGLDHHEPQSLQRRAELGTKKRKVAELTVPSSPLPPPASLGSCSTMFNAGERSRNGKPQNARGAAAVAAEKASLRIVEAITLPRVTRARRRLLSGKDAQLLQLGQNGKPHMQGAADQGDATRNTPGNVRRRLPGSNAGLGNESYHPVV